jgi:hypothetical protein
LGFTEARFRRFTLAQYIAIVEHRSQRDRFSLYGPAMVCSVVANVNRDQKKRRRPFTVEDFLPPDPGKRKPNMSEGGQTPEQMLAICQFLFGGNGKPKPQPEPPTE